MKTYCGVRCLDEAINRITDKTKRRWAAQSASLFSNYIELKDASDLWCKAKPSKDQRVITYIGKYDTKSVAKSMTSFPCRSDFIYHFYSDNANLKSIDPHFQEAKEIEVIEDPIHEVTFSIVWILRKSYGSYKSRDAVLSVLKFTVGEVHYIITHSVDHPDFPKHRTPVRSKLDSVVTEIRSSWNKRDTIVTRLVSEDPKEKVPLLYPGKLVEQTGQGLTRLRKAMSQ